MQVPSFWVRNRKTGQRMKVNVSDWASDLGTSRYAGWERESGEVADMGGLKPEKPIEKTVHEVRSVMPEDEMEKLKDFPAEPIKAEPKRKPGRPRRTTTEAPK